MDSPKNRLQEYFQKLKLPLPTYETTILSGSSHSPFWVSKVTIPSGRVYESTLSHSTKKRAEQDAAETALMAIKKEERDAMITIDLDHNITLAILIDAENKPNVLWELFDKVIFTQGVLFYVFYSQGHHYGKNAILADERIDFVEVGTTRKDGADVGLLMALGGLLDRGDFTDYLIVSGDHFADAAVEIARSHYTIGWTNKRRTQEGCDMLEKTPVRAAKCLTSGDVIRELQRLCA